MVDTHLVNHAGGVRRSDRKNFLLSFLHINSFMFFTISSFIKKLAASDNNRIMKERDNFEFMAGILIALMQAKYQTTTVSPFLTHNAYILTAVVSLVISTAALVAQVKLLAHDSAFRMIIGGIRLTAGGLAVAALMLTLNAILGWITLGLWVMFLSWVAYDSRREVCLLMETFIDTFMQQFGIMGGGMMEVQILLPV